MPRLILILFCFYLFFLYACRDQGIHRNHAEKAQVLFGLNFTDSELDTVMSTLERCLAGYDQMRTVPLENAVLPAFRFDPRPNRFEMPELSDRPFHFDFPETPLLSNDSVAFMSLPQLGSLLRSGQISSVELTQLYLDRLLRLDSTLQSVITLTTDSAFAQARRADGLFELGIDIGPLQGIPYGLKDLASTVGYRTTWGGRTLQVANDRKRCSYRKSFA